MVEFQVAWLSVMVLPKSVEKERTEVLRLTTVIVDPTNVDPLLILMQDKVEMTLYWKSVVTKTKVDARKLHAVMMILSIVETNALDTVREDIVASVVNDVDPRRVEKEMADMTALVPAREEFTMELPIMYR